MLKNELKKLLFKKRFIYILALLLIFEIVSSMVSLNGIFESKRDEEKYLGFISEYSGKITEEKIRDIEEKYNEYNNAAAEKEKLREDVKNGGLGFEEYNIKFEELKEYLSDSVIFSDFYEECEYAFCDTQDRQIVSGKVWLWLFGEEKLDIIIVISIIICVILTVISENETSFSDIRNTCENGRSKLHQLNLSIIYTYSVFITAIICAIKLLLAVRLLSANEFQASVQSIPLFENSRFDISLISAYLLISCLKTVGAAAFSALIVIAGNFLKSSLSVVLFSLLSAVLPPYVISSTEIYYVSPVSLLIGNGFFFGDVIMSGEDVGGTIIYSQAVSSAAIVISLFIAACLILASFTYRKRRFD